VSAKINAERMLNEERQEQTIGIAREKLPQLLSVLLDHSTTILMRVKKVLVTSPRTVAMTIHAVWSSGVTVTSGGLCSHSAVVFENIEAIESGLPVW
jgi:hypothetical protein